MRQTEHLWIPRHIYPSVKQLVPQAFHRYAGFAHYQHFVTAIDRHPVGYRQGATGPPVRISPSVSVQVAYGGKEWGILIGFDTMYREAEALALLGSVDDETVRERRYVIVHSAYELLVAKRSSDVSAIRHAISHPPSELRHKTTVTSLKQMFGTVHIDIDDYYHKKEFYRCMGSMLIEMDQLLAQRIVDKWWSLPKAILPPRSLG